MTKYLSATLATKAIISIPAVLLAGCGGGLSDLIGDGGARVVVTGPIMGKNREVCINNPPTQMTPGDIQEIVDQYIFKAVRWDSGATVRKKIEGDRSCSLNLDPYATIEWADFISTGENSQLADWGNMVASFTANGERVVKVCVWDNQCEDGDVLDITINGTRVVRRELVNQPSCTNITVNNGVNYLGVFAVNGTGHKGNCSYEDRNTGMVSVQGATGNAVTQTYSVKGGQGSYGSLTIVN